MGALTTLVLLAVLLAAPCFVQLVLWGAYRVLRAVLVLANISATGQLRTARAKA